MLRLVVFLWLIAIPARAGEPAFVRAPEFPHAGPASAKGALIWIHGTYGKDQTGPPGPPDFVARESAAGLDIWCLNRTRTDDALDRGAEFLVRSIARLRDDGYRRIIVAGHSRGAWIALTVLAHPGLANGVVAFSPAAHGTRDDRKSQALADWAALWAAAANDGTHVVLVQLAGDAWDPDPARRLTVARNRFGGNLLSIFQPETPDGHAGVYEPAFDEQFGARIAAFLP